MSGICGILRLDAAPAAGLASMLRCLDRRGPDATRSWSNGPVALGHTLLATTPESLHESLPLTHAPTGCTITADVRLDNREELLETLGLRNAGRVVGDGELILQAYLRWGEDSPTRLLGDWAFAIWDPRERRLFAARDPMGSRQLAYAHVPGRVLALATDARAVLSAEGVPCRLNEGRVVDFLEDYEALDVTSTFYRDVAKLPPGHRLLAGSGAVRVSSWWTLDPPAPLRLADDRAYADAFLDVFAEAVRCRLRSAGPVGSLLSGGMDSGSIVAVAPRLLAAQGKGPLFTFSVIGPDPDSDIETRSVLAASRLPGLAPRFVDWSDLGDWRDDLLRLLAEIDEPFDGRMDILRAAYLAARRAGVRVVLDGGGGDVAFASSSHIGRLLRQFRWRQAWREAAGEARFFRGTTVYDGLRGGLIRAALPEAVRHWRRARVDRLRDAAGWPWVLPGLARAADLPARRHAFYARRFAKTASFREERVSDLFSPEQVTGLERYERIGAAVGVEPRDPYRDVRLVRFVLGLPMAQLQHDGWRKIIQRRAMEGLLPDEIRWRLGNEHLGADMSSALLLDSGPPLYDADVAPLPALAALGKMTQNDLNFKIHPAWQLYLRAWLERQDRLGVTGDDLFGRWVLGKG